jgi:hypothetical protein
MERGRDQGYFPDVGTKAERRAARERVSGYHERELAALIEHVAQVIDRYRAGEIDALVADDTIHHYHRAAQELWKFCWSGGAGANTELIDAIIERQSISGESVDWWQRGQPRRPR